MITSIRHLWLNSFHFTKNHLSISAISCDCVTFIHHHCTNFHCSRRHIYKKARSPCYSWSPHAYRYHRCLTCHSTTSGQNSCSEGHIMHILFTCISTEYNRLSSDCKDFLCLFGTQGYRSHPSTRRSHHTFRNHFSIIIWVQ